MELPSRKYCLFIAVSMSKLRNPKCLHKLFVQCKSVAWLNSDFFSAAADDDCDKVVKGEAPAFRGRRGNSLDRSFRSRPDISRGAGTSANDFVNPVAIWPPPPPRGLPTTARTAARTL